MANPVEPMDVDSDFDNKENSYHHSNVLPCTEKGYEELDVSELNMKLRYSATPASSPMSKSFTANYVDNRGFESGNVTANDNENLTRSLNSSLKNDSVIKSVKVLPLQSISTEQFNDTNRSTSVLRPLDSTITPDNANISVTVIGPNDIDENLSLASSSSSTVHTPEATTPTTDICKTDGGSPIIRGLKSVLNMFRSSQSPIPPENEGFVKQEVLSPVEVSTNLENSKIIMASTPISAHHRKERSPSKRNSPHKGSIVFNEDLEKELQWKDETTILFSKERIPIHKLFFQPTQPTEDKSSVKLTNEVQDIELDSTVEYMDISYNDSMLRDKTMTYKHAGGNKTETTIAGESDSEFVDCETTFTKNELHVNDDDETLVNQKQDLTKDMSKNDSTSKLKPIILNTTQDILDATLSITPEDIYSEVSYNTRELPHTSGIEIKDSNKLNETKVIEQVVGNEQEAIHEQKINQTFEAVNQTINIDSDNLNVTKTIENIPTGIEKANDSSSINNLDATRTIEVDSKPLEEQAAAQNGIHCIENQIVILENLDIPVPHSEILDMTHTVQNDNVESQIIIDEASHLDIIKSIKMITAEHNKLMSNATVQHTEPSSIEKNTTAVKLEDHPIVDLADNLNIITEYVLNDNKTEDHSNIPFRENNNLITEHEFAIEQINKSKDVTDTENANNVTTVEDTGKLIKGKPNETLISLEYKPHELPADIPLPDEDEIDIELNVTVENTAGNINTVPCSSPAHLVEDTKIQSQDTDSTKVIPAIEIEDELVLQEILHQNMTNNEVIDDKDYIVELPVSEHTQELQEIIINKSVETEDVLQRNLTENLNNEMLPKDIPSPDNLITEHGKFTTNELNSSKVFNETQTITEPINDAKLLPNEIQDIKPVIDVPIPIDNIESVCENKPLPDIINQITTSCKKNIEQTITGIELVEHQSLVGLACISDDIENIPAVPPVTQIPTAEVYIPQESGFCEKTETSDILIVKTVTEEIPIVSKTDETKIINDTISNMSINEQVEGTENVKDDLHSDIATAASVPTLAQTHNVSPKLEKELITTPAASVGAKVIQDAKIIDEEIVTSDNNSLFVCVSAEPETQTDNNKEDPFATKTRLECPPPASPPIASKGYNFNFDEFDDPFATQTKTPISSNLDTPNKCTEPKQSERNAKKPTMTKKDVNNRRKSQTGRKRPHNMKLNSTFNTTPEKALVDRPVEVIEVVPTINEFEEIKSKPMTASFDTEDKEVQDIIKTANKNIEEKFQEALKINKEKICRGEKLVGAAPVVENTSVDSISEAKSSSSSEQSTYFSAGTSSGESIKSKNVFNLPEIDDMNFNPFESKSKMRQSPPLSQDIDNPFDARSKIMSSPDIPLNDAKINVNEAIPTSDDKIETELMEKDSSTNISNTTTSSKATDERDVTIREINTEDEDTAEGPFFEVEDLHNEVQMTDLDTENDMMHFNEVPPQVAAENQDNDELFIDAEAFEFLLNQNKSNSVVDSGKESLFLKFDPLFAKRISSDGVLAALTQLQKSQSTPMKLTKLPQKEPVSPIAGPSNMNITHNVDMNTSEELTEDHNITVSKPMMVVPPAVNPVTPRNKPVTPTRSNRRSVTFTSPAMAVIDRLLSLSANNSPIYENNFTHVSREHNEADLALTQLRELLAEKEVHVYNLRTESKELKDRLSTMESQVRSLELESQTRLKKINDLNETLVEKTKINKSMALVVEEYERTIASLISEIEQDKKRHAEERMKLINERDEQTAHLASMEVSFSDLHSKYEKSKQVIFSCKSNEDAYKKSLKEFEENVTKMQNNFDLLKQHATSKLNHANHELEKMNKAHEAEVLKLSAMIKRKELHITSLEETLTQKTKANEELTSICDELINKVG